MLSHNHVMMMGLWQYNTPTVTTASRQIDDSSSSSVHRAAATGPGLARPAGQPSKGCLAGSVVHLWVPGLPAYQHPLWKEASLQHSHPNPVRKTTVQSYQLCIACCRSHAVMLYPTPRRLGGGERHCTLHTHQ